MDESVLNWFKLRLRSGGANLPAPGTWEAYNPDEDYDDVPELDHVGGCNCGDCT